MHPSLSLFGRLLATAALAAAPLTASLAAPTFSWSSPSGALHPAGSHFSVDLIATGFTDLYAYQFSVAFDPAVVHVLGVTEGSFLPSGGFTFFDGGTIDNAAGRISFAFDSLVAAIPGVSGSGVLAHVDLAALAAGSTTLQLGDVLALDSLLNEIIVSALPITLAVPEPSTVALLLVAAGGGLLTRRRSRPGQRPAGTGFAA